MCDICGKQYSWREALKKHKRTKHEYYESSVSYDCTTVTSSLISENNPLHEENNDDMAVLPRVNSEVSVEEIEIGPILRSGISFTNPKNEHNSMPINTTIAPVVLGAKLSTHAPSLVSGCSSGSAEKVMDFSPVIPVVSETNCEVDYNKVPDGNSLPLMISNGQNTFEREPLMNSVIPSVATETCDDIFPNGEPQDITSGHVEEVVIVETDSSVNYDYIVYHVSS